MLSSTLGYFLYLQPLFRPSWTLFSLHAAFTHRPKFTITMTQLDPVSPSSILMDEGDPGGNQRDVSTTLNYYPADSGPPIPVIVGELVAPSDDIGVMMLTSR